jgi:hypothetical protein
VFRKARQGQGDDLERGERRPRPQRHRSLGPAGDQCGAALRSAPPRDGRRPGRGPERSDAPGRHSVSLWRPGHVWGRRPAHAARPPARPSHAPRAAPRARPPRRVPGRERGGAQRGPTRPATAPPEGGAWAMGPTRCSALRAGWPPAALTGSRRGDQPRARRRRGARPGGRWWPQACETPEPARPQRPGPSSLQATQASGARWGSRRSEAPGAVALRQRHGQACGPSQGVAAREPPGAWGARGALASGWGTRAGATRGLHWCPAPRRLGLVHTA